MIHARTIKEAAAHYKELDPHTALTETAIRIMLAAGYLQGVHERRTPNYGKY